MVEWKCYPTNISIVFEPSIECYKYHNFMNQCLPSELFPVHLPVRVVRDNIGYGDTSNLPHEYLMNIQ